MNIKDDRFIHFTTEPRAEQIVESKKLLLDPPAHGMGAYGVFAVSLVYGKHYPSVTLTHVQNQAKQEGSNVVAIEFTTNTVPKKYGHPDETGWGEQDVNLINPRIINVEEAISKISRSPVKLGEDDMVLYDKSVLNDEELSRLKDLSQPDPIAQREAAMRVVATWLLLKS